MTKPAGALLMLACAVCVTAACQDASAPDRARVSPASPAFLTSVVVAGPEYVPLEDGETMPESFLAAPLIQSKMVDVGFRPAYAYAAASMRYYATHGRTTVKLRLKRGEMLVDQDSATSSNEELFPSWNDAVVARATISTPDTCGYRADAAGVFSAWMGFPIPRTGNLFTWGHITTQASGTASQPDCKTVVPYTPGGEYDDNYYLGNIGEGAEGESPYDGSCETCQLWLAFVNGIFYSYWWECTEVDPSYCESLNEAR